MYYIGIDLGTSSLKAVLINDRNEVIKTSTKLYDIYHPSEGYSEQNPIDWWKKTKESIIELTIGIDVNLIKCIGVSGQMHGLVLLDKHGKVIRPAILWNDVRTEIETDYLNNEIGKNKLLSYTGNIAYAGFTLPKLLWVKNNEPHNYNKISHILLPKDYIVHKLTGAFSTDFSDASGTLLLDVKNKIWSKDMCKIGYVKEDWLPKLHESYDVVGKLLKDISLELRLNCNTKVIAGAGDNAASAISVGALDEGTCNISLGTSGTVFIPTSHFIQDNNNSLHSFAHANGKFHLMGTTLSAASSYKWWLESVLESKEYQEEQNNIKRLGENTIYFMPYLNGERSPYNDENIRAGFIGINSSSTRKDMTLAVLEGVAYSLRDCIECSNKLDVFPNTATIVGGGSKSDIWCKIICNILKIKIIRMEEERGPALGIAILAKYFEKFEERFKELTKYENKVKIFEPEPELVNKYEKGYRKYKKLYPMLKSFYFKN